MQGLPRNLWCRSTQASLHGSLNLFVNFSGNDAPRYCNKRQSWTGVGHKIREENCRPRHSMLCHSGTSGLAVGTTKTV